MGYESRIYIVEPLLQENEHGKTYAEIVAMFEMGHLPEFPGIFSKESMHCILVGDCTQKQVEKDAYGKPLTELSLSDCIVGLSKLTQEYSFTNEKILLHVLLDFFNEGNPNLVVIHYGH